MKKRSSAIPYSMSVLPSCLEASTFQPKLMRVIFFSYYLLARVWSTSSAIS